MGYDVHITRAKDWTGSESLPIGLEEGKEYVATDPELILEAAAIAQLDGVSLAYENDGLAVWTSFSGHGLNGNKAWFDYQQGRITVKSPTDEIVRKMKRVAAKLSARVLGDEGEQY